MSARTHVHECSEVTVSLVRAAVLPILKKAPSCGRKPVALQEMWLELASNPEKPERP